MKKKCVSCGAKIEINSNFCTVCGTNQTSDKHHKGVIAKWFSRFNTSKDTKAGNGYLTYAEDGYPTYHFSKEQEEKYQNQQEEKEARKQQILTFKLEDMTQYEDLPFLWNKDLLYSYNKDQAYMRLWQENQDIACMYVDQIAKLIYDATDYIPDIKHCIIDPAQIDFNYRKADHPYTMPYTYLECVPFTKAGKKPKYPAILHFGKGTKMFDGTGEMAQYMGTIKILQDGQIGAAEVVFTNDYRKFSISLYGLSLVIRRVDTMYENIFKFEDIKL